MSLLGGCQSGDDPEAQETTTTVAAPPSTAAPSTTSAASTATTAPLRPDMSPDEIAVRNVLDLFAAEQTSALENPDPDHPGLNAVVTGPLKETIRQEMAADRDEGLFYRRQGGGANPHRTEHVRFEGPNVAIAMECHIGDRFTYRQGTVEPIDASVSSYHVETKVYREDDQQWRIGERTLTSKVPGTKECYGLD